MPQSAIDFVAVDHVASPEHLAARLLELAGQPVPEPAARARRDPEMEAQEERNADMSLVSSLGQPSPFTCPDCGGVLWEIDDGELVRYRCHTGHAFSPESLSKGKSEDLEVALWAALRALKEKLELTRRLAERARSRGRQVDLGRAEDRMKFLEQQVSSLRSLIEKL